MVVTTSLMITREVTTRGITKVRKISIKLVNQASVRLKNQVSINKNEDSQRAISESVVFGDIIGDMNNLVSYY